MAANGETIGSSSKIGGITWDMEIRDHITYRVRKEFLYGSEFLGVECFHGKAQDTYNLMEKISSEIKRKIGLSLEKMNGRFYNAESKIIFDIFHVPLEDQAEKSLYAAIARDLQNILTPQKEVAKVYSYIHSDRLEHAKIEKKNKTTEFIVEILLRVFAISLNSNIELSDIESKEVIEFITKFISNLEVINKDSNRYCYIKDISNIWLKEWRPSLEACIQQKRDWEANKTALKNVISSLEKIEVSINLNLVVWFDLHLTKNKYIKSVNIKASPDHQMPPPHKLAMDSLFNILKEDIFRGLELNSLEESEKQVDSKFLEHMKRYMENKIVDEDVKNVYKQYILIYEQLIIFTDLYNVLDQLHTLIKSFGWLLILKGMLSKEEFTAFVEEKIKYVLRLFNELNNSMINIQKKRGDKGTASLLRIHEILYGERIKGDQRIIGEWEAKLDVPQAFLRLRNSLNTMHAIFTSNHVVVQKVKDRTDANLRALSEFEKRYGIIIFNDTISLLSDIRSNGTDCRNALAPQEAMHMSRSQSVREPRHPFDSSRDEESVKQEKIAKECSGREFLRYEAVNRERLDKEVAMSLADPDPNYSSNVTQKRSKKKSISPLPPTLSYSSASRQPPSTVPTQGSWFQFFPYCTGEWKKESIPSDKDGESPDREEIKPFIFN